MQVDGLDRFTVTRAASIAAPFAPIRIDRRALLPDHPLTLYLEMVAQLRTDLPATGYPHYCGAQHLLPQAGPAFV